MLPRAALYGQHSFWQIQELYFIGVGKDHKTFDDIFKLSDIARPVVVLQAFDGGLGHLLLGNILLEAMLFEKILDQKRNVVCTLSQRRDMDGNHVQAVEQVLPEFVFSDARSKSLLVAAKMRTSTSTVLDPPTLWILVSEVRSGV